MNPNMSQDMSTRNTRPSTGQDAPAKMPGRRHITLLDRGLGRCAATITLWIAWLAASQPWTDALAGEPATTRLKVSANQRYLVRADGRPFFYLGDTAWELFHRLNREEADRYLQNRAAKGFTVIQAVVLAELDGLKTPNANGDVPFVDLDISRPNEAYFKHVDYIVDKAASLGLYIGMLPSWGDKVGAYGDYFINEDNARPYGRFLGRRYKDKPIIWILGGDRPPDVTAEIWTQMAAGLKEGDGGRHLMTFHPFGGGHSSVAFHYSDWLDFNMVQSGHNPTSANYSRIQMDYNLRPPKPCMDGEPAYEYPPDAMPSNRPVGALEVRRRAYWALFSGAHGHTYGTHPIWQMYAPPRTPLWDVKTPWYDAMDLPGCKQLAYVKALLFSRPFLARIPDQLAIYSGLRGGLEYVSVTRDGRADRNDATYLMAYFPQHASITFKTDRLAGKTVRGWWFNPRDGAAQPLGEFKKQARMEFSPPTKSTTEDWVLVLDDATKNYPPPGVAIRQPGDRR
jgi:hypothetical protein